MTLLADDGTVLKPKEGIVLDTDGHQLTRGPTRGPHDSQHFGSVSRSFSLPIPAVIGAVLFIPLAITLGAAFFGVVAVLLVLFLVVRTISRVLR